MTQICSRVAQFVINPELELGWVRWRRTQTNGDYGVGPNFGDAVTDPRGDFIIVRCNNNEQFIMHREAVKLRYPPVSIGNPLVYFDKLIRSKPTELTLIYYVAEMAPQDLAALFDPVPDVRIVRKFKLEFTSESGCGDTIVAFRAFGYHVPRSGRFVFSTRLSCQQEPLERNIFARVHRKFRGYTDTRRQIGIIIDSREDYYTLARQMGPITEELEQNFAVTSVQLPRVNSRNRNRFCLTIDVECALAKHIDVALCANYAMRLRAAFVRRLCSPPNTYIVVGRRRIEIMPRSFNNYVWYLNHARLLEILLALAPLRIDDYGLLWILQLSDAHFMAQVERRMIATIGGVRRSYLAIVARREARAAHNLRPRRYAQK